MKKARVKITWIKSKVKSGQPVISALPYRPIIAFKGQYNKPIWEGKISTVPLWSSQIFNEKVSGEESISTLTYMAENAPFEFMQIGAEFELYEGPNKVAIGVIIEGIS